ncbi:DUF4145 domain-containing protein [Xanthomonas phaseoli]|uniref:DUF4145 domain-containing protein n=1 Tax=Xanthomonas phaseoli TaxID=1985254 RepID=UPI0006996F1C|nr:DUF4145 domain-containing protein [Xanthomonas phaseoli]UZB30935.1 DUF4145 domain-containing protein [Xanthomonas phaseoli pv. phaseoli]
MSILVTTCPHCLAERMAMRAVARCHIDQEKWTVMLACGGCHGILCVVVACVGDMDWVEWHGSFSDHLARYGGYLVKMYPKAEETTCPAGVSDGVRRSFLQGGDNALRGNNDAAASMFRKALDLATRELDATLAGKTLVTRINALEAAGKLTSDLKEWAHLIRLDGNNGAHDDEELPADQIEQLRMFTELFLVYTFTLPADVRARKAQAVVAPE